jgi:hypothetical protein
MSLEWNTRKRLNLIDPAVGSEEPLMDAHDYCYDVRLDEVG